MRFFSSLVASLALGTLVACGGSGGPKEIVVGEYGSLTGRGKET